MEHIRLHNLFFLASLAPLGCVIVSDDEDTGNDDAGTGATSVAMTDTAPSDDTAGTPTDGADDAPADSSGGGDTAADSGSGGSDSAATTTGVEPGPCADYGATIEYCYNARMGAAAAEYCQEYSTDLYDNYGADCLAAYDDFVACLADLDCRTLMAGEVCTDEEDALGVACAGK